MALVLRRRVRHRWAARQNAVTRWSRCRARSTSPQTPPARRWPHDPLERVRTRPHPHGGHRGRLGHARQRDEELIRCLHPALLAVAIAADAVGAEPDGELVKTAAAASGRPPATLEVAFHPEVIALAGTDPTVQALADGTLPVLRPAQPGHAPDAAMFTKR